MAAVYQEDGGEKKRKGNLRNVQQAAALPENYLKSLKDRVHGPGMTMTTPTLVMEKILTEANLTDGHNRFIIPMDELLRDDFLTEKQKRHLSPPQKGEKTKNNFIGVKVIAPSSSEENAHFYRLDLGKANGGVSSVYAINGIVNKFDLKKGMKMQLWSYKVNGELWFAFLNLVPKGMWRLW